MGSSQEFRPSKEQIDALTSKYYSGDFHLAKELAEEMVLNYPMFSLGYMILGCVAGHMGDSRSAQNIFTVVICLGPNESFSYLNLGHAMRSSEIYSDAGLAYGRALRITPGAAEIYCFIGQTKKHSMENVDAEKSFRTAICLKPDFAEAHSYLQSIHVDQGRLMMAKAHAEWEVYLEPRLAEAHCRLGLTLLHLGDLKLTGSSLLRAIVFNPHLIEALIFMGRCRGRQGELLQSESWLRRAQRLDYSRKDIVAALADLYFDWRRITEANYQYINFIALCPDSLEFWHKLGNGSFNLGAVDKSINCLKKAVSLNPKDHRIHNDLGISLHFNGALIEAESSYLEALRLNPNFAEAYCNLSGTLGALGKVRAYEISCRRAIALDPCLADAYNNLGAAYKDQRRLIDSALAFERCIRINPLMLDAMSNRLYVLSFTEECSPDQYYNEVCSFGRAISPTEKKSYTYWNTNPNASRLSVGIVSGDLRTHSVGFFIEACIREINPKLFRLIAYPTLHVEDELTARIKPYFEAWEPLCGVSDEDAAERIWRSGVDILLDLSGHTYGNRLGVFALKPAPVQVSWLGWWASTGVPQMDYLLGDPHVTPDSERHHFMEEICQLPETRFCFTPPEIEIEVSDLPAMSSGYVTFGCFNDLSKVNNSVVAVWCELLKKLPSARILLKCRQLGDEIQRKLVLAQFEGHGVDPDRVFLEGASPLQDYYAAYHAVDITLDTFPYPGGTTSVQSLWMGVPVLALEGDRLLSHQGEGILKGAGLSGWVARDRDQYIEMAVSWASSLADLGRLRKKLRGQVLESPLFDSKRFARNLEIAIVKMHEKSVHDRSSVRLNPY